MKHIGVVTHTDGILVEDDVRSYMHQNPGTEWLVIAGSHEEDMVRDALETCVGCVMKSIEVPESATSYDQALAMLPNCDRLFATWDHRESRVMSFITQFKLRGIDVTVNPYDVESIKHPEATND